MTQPEEEHLPPLWPLRRWRLVGGEAAGTDEVVIEGTAGLAEPALADESPLVGDAALLGEQTLLGELALEDEALLLGV